VQFVIAIEQSSQLEEVVSAKYPLGQTEQFVPLRKLPEVQLVHWDAEVQVEQFAREEQALQI
jgi:hypothetical protein